MGSNIPKIGTSDIEGCYLGSDEIEKVYLGSDLIYEKSVTPTELIGYTTVGTLTDNNGIISGFSSSNYGVLPAEFSPQDEPFEINIRFGLYSDGNNRYRHILGSNNTNWSPVVYRRNVDQYGSNYRTISSSALNGLNILSSTSAGNLGITTYPSDVNVNLKSDNRTSTYKIIATVNGTEVINTNSASGTIGSVPSLLFYLGYGSYNSSSWSGFEGYIDLNHCYINKSGVRWWSGVAGAN